MEELIKVLNFTKEFLIARCKTVQERKLKLEERYKQHRQQQLEAEEEEKRREEQEQDELSRHRKRKSAHHRSKGSRTTGTHHSQSSDLSQQNTKTKDNKPKKDKIIKERLVSETAPKRDTHLQTKSQTTFTTNPTINSSTLTSRTYPILPNSSYSPPPPPPQPHLKHSTFNSVNSTVIQQNDLNSVRDEKQLQTKSHQVDEMNRTSNPSEVLSQEKINTTTEGESQTQPRTETQPQPQPQPQPQSSQTPPTSLVSVAKSPSIALRCVLSSLPRILFSSSQVILTLFCFDCLVV
jgi:hypothetical protein